MHAIFSCLLLLTRQFILTSVKIPIFLVFTPLSNTRHQVQPLVERQQPHNPQHLLRKTAVESVIVIHVSTQITLITFNHLYIQIIIMSHKLQPALYHHRMYNQISVYRKQVIAIGRIIRVRVVRKIMQESQVKQPFPLHNTPHHRLRQRYLIVSRKMRITNQNVTQKHDIRYCLKVIPSHPCWYQIFSKNYKRCGCK